MILGGGQVSLKAGKQGTTIYVQEPDGSDGYYHLPPSLRNKLRVHLRSKSYEEKMIILDSNGTEVARTESKADSEMGQRAASKRKREGL